MHLFTKVCSLKCNCVLLSILRMYRCTLCCLLILFHYAIHLQNNFIVWMSVLAVLTIQFARTIALALTIADFSKGFADRFLLPIVRKATPKEYQVCMTYLILQSPTESNYPFPTVYPHLNPCCVKCILNSQYRNGALYY